MVGDLLDLVPAAGTPDIRLREADAALYEYTRTVHQATRLDNGRSPKPVMNSLRAPVPSGSASEMESPLRPPVKYAIRPPSATTPR